MLSLETVLALALFAFVSSITPGPNNLMLMASGTNFGFARTAPHMAGVAIGFMVMMGLVGAGLGAFLQAYPAAMQVLKYASIAYLLYLAWKTATAASAQMNASTGAKPLSFLQAAAFQWVNPKAWTMALTSMAVYVPAQDRGLGIALVTLIFSLVGLPAIALWTATGVQLRRLLHRPRALRTFNICAALLLVASLYPMVAPDTIG